MLPASLSSAMRPRFGATMPAMHFKSVLLPLPLAPSRTTVSPSATRSEMSCNTRTAP
jgi:hypothetical protein